jgi:F0F1-type ATP synthase assembly protein I
MQIAFTMAFYVAAGLGLDFWLGTLPFLTILGALAGLATVLYQVVRVADELGQRDEPDGDGQSEGEEYPKE